MVFSRIWVHSYVAMHAGYGWREFQHQRATFGVRKLDFVATGFAVLSSFWAVLERENLTKYLQNSVKTHEFVLKTRFNDSNPS